MANIPQREGGSSGGSHPKNQSEGQGSQRDIVKQGSMDRSKDTPQNQQGQPGQNQQQGQWPQQQFTDDDREMMRKRQQDAWDLAAEREKSNNPATKPQRQYDKNAPGMHPANQPEPTTKIDKATRLDLEDITGNPGHRQVNPDAPAGSINGPGVDRTGRYESINEPSHVDQNWPQRSAEGVKPGKGATGPRPGTQEAAGAGWQGSINEPPGSQVIPEGAGQGAGGGAGGIGTEYETPEIEELEPDEVEAGSAADITMHVHGSGFTDKSVITFNHLDEPTVFVSESEVTTIVKPSLFTVADVVDVTVKNGAYESEPVEFEFLEPEVPAASRQTKRAKPKPPGKGKGKASQKKGKR
jgi:hypothetical protein